MEADDEAVELRDWMSEEYDPDRVALSEVELAREETTAVLEGEAELELVPLDAASKHF